MGYEDRKCKVDIVLVRLNLTSDGLKFLEVTLCLLRELCSKKQRKVC